MRESWQPLLILKPQTRWRYGDLCNVPRPPEHDRAHLLPQDSGPSVFPQIVGGEVGTEGQPVSPPDGKDGDVLSMRSTPETSSLVFQPLEHVTVLTGQAACVCVCVILTVQM